MKRQFFLSIALTALIGCAARPSTHIAPAFYVAEFSVRDAEGYKPYAARVEATLAPYGGHFVARGGSATSLEGAPVNGKLVVIAFDNVERAQAWYHSAAYKAIRPIRQRTANTRAYIIEGLWSGGS